VLFEEIRNTRKYQVSCFRFICIWSDKMGIIGERCLKMVGDVNTQFFAALYIVHAYNLTHTDKHPPPPPHAHPHTKTHTKPYTRKNVGCHRKQAFT
jgi:hypothetical protein